MSLRMLHSPRRQNISATVFHVQPVHGLRGCRVYSPYVAPGRVTSASIAASWPEATEYAQSRQRATELAWRRRAYDDNVVGSCGSGEGVVDEGLLR